RRGDFAFGPGRTGEFLPPRPFQSQDHRQGAPDQRNLGAWSVRQGDSHPLLSDRSKRKHPISYVSPHAAPALLSPVKISIPKKDYWPFLKTSQSATVYWNLHTCDVGR